MLIDFSHHAYLISGDFSVLKVQLVTYLKNEYNIEIQGNPDFFSEHYERFGIDDGRSIRVMQSRKTLVDKQIFIIGFDAITREAQNALLKMFEEPNPDTYFFVITPIAGSLLPTLQSRFEKLILTDEKILDKGLMESVHKFITADTGERLADIETLLKEESKSQSVQFVHAIEAYVVQKGRNVLGDAIYTDALKSLAEITKYIHDQSASHKLLLEHLALTLPRIE